jgi:hypothetical protein
MVAHPSCLQTAKSGLIVTTKSKRESGLAKRIATEKSAQMGSILAKLLGELNSGLSGANGQPDTGSNLAATNWS